MHTSVIVLFMSLCAPICAAVAQVGAVVGEVADPFAEVRPRVDVQHVRAAFDRLKAAASEGQWFARWDDRTELPVLLRGGLSRGYDGTHADAATTFLTDHAALFALDHPGVTVRVRDDIDASMGVHRVTMEQRFHNLPVVYGTMRLVVDAQNRVQYAASTFWPIAPDLNIQPVMARSIAIDRARTALPDANGTWDAPSLAVYPKGDGILAWLVNRRLSQQDVLPWELAVDATTGDVLEHRSVIKQHAQEQSEKTNPSVALDFNPSPAPDFSGTATRTATPARVSKPRGLAQSAAAGVPPPGPSPCHREWELVGPAGETLVVPEPGPEDPYRVVIGFGLGNLDSEEDDTQAEAVYGAGIKLLPGIEYTITFTWDIYTWDSYNATWGYWDVFFVHMNSLGFLWSHPLGVPEHLSSNTCSTTWTPFHEDLQGPLWTFGGDQHSDMDLCTSTGTFSFTYFEPDHNEIVYLSTGLDTLITGAVDGLMPSWGALVLEITGKTMSFNPNPVTALAIPSLVDDDDENDAVPTVAYEETTLTHLTPPAPGEPWMLTGTYAKLAVKPTPDGKTEIVFEPPTSRNGIFPYLRDCDAFEAVNAYRHITANQLYIQSLGFAFVNNRQIEVDPHNFTQNQAYYIPSPSGLGYVIFGDGGVDDAEDADVVIHEYAHAIQDNQSPGAYDGVNDPSTLVDETGAFGEAFSDYWACSSFRAQSMASGFDPSLFADWDATNGLFPTGLRDLTNSMVYPRDIVEDNIHATGQIWSGAMWTVLSFLGKPYTDRLTIFTNYLIPDNPNFVQAAEATLEADDIIAGGVNKPGLVGGFVGRGIFRKLDVESKPNGAAIDVDESDVFGFEDGAAPFSRVYPHYQLVILIAPAMHAGKPFRHWRIDGVNDLLPSEFAVMLMDDPNPPTFQPIRTARAVYLTPADLNGDGVVGVPDLLTVINAWGACDAPCPPYCPEDLNLDCTVGVPDLLLVINNWGG